MNKKIFFLKVLVYISTSLWSMVGIITIGSIYNSSLGMMINLTMGLVFILFSFYIYKKGVNSIYLLNELDHLKSDTEKPFTTVSTYANKFIFTEMISILFTLALGGVALTGVVTRVFIEKFAVFG